MGEERTCQTIEDWFFMGDPLAVIVNVINLVMAVSIGLASLVILINIVFAKKLPYSILITTPAFFLVYSVVWAIATFYRLQGGNKTRLVIICTILGKFFFMMATWAFKIQYLKTSLVLPKFFLQAKLEHELARA